MSILAVRSQRGSADLRTAITPPIIQRITAPIALCIVK